MSIAPSMRKRGTERGGEGTASGLMLIRKRVTPEAEEVLQAVQSRTPGLGGSCRAGRVSQGGTGFRVDREVDDT